MSAFLVPRARGNPNSFYVLFIGVMDSLASFRDCVVFYSVPAHISPLIKFEGPLEAITWQDYKIKDKHYKYNDIAHLDS